MTNVVVLIGAIEKSYFDEELKICVVELKLRKTVQVSYDVEEFETYKIKLWKGIYSDVNSLKSFTENLILGVKGRLEIINDSVYICAETVSFLGKNK